MANNFSTSVNIIRDIDRDFQYIPTPNAKQVVNQIVNDYKKGIRSFNIIGTYGTGKSAFLLALEKSINGSKRYFNPNFIQNPKVSFVKIIGSYNSIVECFADIFDVSTKKNRHENIFSEIFNKYHSLGRNNKMLFLYIDEFGKFLEYASKNDSETELYFIQQLTEFCNNPKHNIVLISTLHQSFASYAYSMTLSQKQEWTKVGGRFREITFNEPVEQLLYLASQYVSETLDSKIYITKSSIQKVLDLASGTNAFNFNKDFLGEIAFNLYPLDILAANTLTHSLQRYGQNERSLFSFLESTDHTGLSKFNKRENQFYNISCVYDYLNFNFYSFLTSKFNPEFASWSSIRASLDKVERSFDESLNEYTKIIKTIGLLNIFSASGANLERSFLIKYLELTSGLKNADVLISLLEEKQIIRFRNHSNRFVLFEGTDLDIQSALFEAGNQISVEFNLIQLLNKHFTFEPLFVKRSSYKFGTPRFFKFVISDYPISEIPAGQIDGFVNLIFNTKLKVSDVQNKSAAQKEAIVYCYFKNSEEIKNSLFEIEKINKVIEQNSDDKIAQRELLNIVDSQVRLLNHYIFESIYSGSKDVKWFFQGTSRPVLSKRDFNELLSTACNEVYTAIPTFKNELVNKHKISSSIHTAKRNYFKALTNNWVKENLGFEENKFPPEKTIFLSLLKDNGIKPTQADNIDTPKINKSSTFNKLWRASEKFIESTKYERKSIAELNDILLRRPFKLKQGLIDFWVPTFLFLKRDDFAIFGEEGYIHTFSSDNMELIVKYPSNYTIKAFDVAGVKLDIFYKYRAFLNQTSEFNFGNSSFIETIKPFIVFYKGLPEYSKQTKRLSETALRIRDAIATSRDPEETFFNDFPAAIGISLSTLQRDKSQLQSYTQTLQEAIRELRTSYDHLVDRFEEFICAEIIGEKIEFEEYKGRLQSRFNILKKHLLLSSQKTFVQRIDSTLDDRKAWLNSIAQSVIGKTLESFVDSDEFLLYEKFKVAILELDSLTYLSKPIVNEEKEEIIGVKIDAFFTKIDPKIIRLPKAKGAQVELIKNDLKKRLSKDRTSNIAALVNLLKEIL